MQDGDKLFGNILHDEKITAERLYDFLGDTIARLTAQNANGEFTTLIDLLTAVRQTLGSELSDVDTSQNLLKGKTKTNDEVLADFKHTMSIKEGVIADSLGGYETEAYLEFYPDGQNEYSRATKTEMPTLVDRIFDATSRNSGSFSTNLKELLQSFQELWKTSRDRQEAKKGELGDNREEKSDAQLAAELAGVTVIRTIAAKFPGDVAKCSSFFNFNLLFTAGHHKKPDVYKNTIAAGAAAVAFNKSYSTATQFTLTNESENADYLAYLAATADAQPGLKTVLVKAAKTHHVSYADLDGGENKPFLIIKNLSPVNEVKYVVEAK